MQLFYDGIAPRYMLRDEGQKRFFHNRSELPWLSELFFAGQRVLDVGSGAGRLAGYLSNTGLELLVSADLSFEMLKVAQVRIRYDSCKQLVQCDAEHLPFAQGFFRHVVCLGLFEYVADLKPFLCEFFRVMMPGGKLLFTCRNSKWMFNERRRYPIAEYLSEAVEAALHNCGYRILRHETIYHLDGRGIGFVGRLFARVKGDAHFVRLLLSLNQRLQRSRHFHDRGKTHLVLAERN